MNIEDKGAVVILGALFIILTGIILVSHNHVLKTISRTQNQIDCAEKGGDYVLFMGTHNFERCTVKKVEDYY